MMDPAHEFKGTQSIADQVPLKLNIDRLLEGAGDTYYLGPDHLLLELRVHINVAADGQTELKTLPD